MTALAAAFIVQLAATPACTVPGMVPEFWPGVIKVESHGDPWALHDDTADQAFYPTTPALSEELAIRLMNHGHSVGVGLSQLTASSPQEFWNKFGLTIHDALDACANMKAGAQHYVDRALSIYNSGSPTASLPYARAVTASVRAIKDGSPATAPVPTVPAPKAPRMEEPMHDAVHVHPTTPKEPS